MLKRQVEKKKQIKGTREKLNKNEKQRVKELITKYKRWKEIISKENERRRKNKMEKEDRI